MSSGIEAELVTLTKVFMETGYMLQEELGKLNSVLRTIATDIDNAEFEIQQVASALEMIAESLKEIKSTKQEGDSNVL